MLQYPNIDPIILSIGPLSIRWYGLMYILGVIIAWFLGIHRIKKNYYSHLELDNDKFLDLVLYITAGLLIGGRLGYMFFYKYQLIIYKPWEIFMIWQGGMSFHGGILGGMLGVYLFSRQYHKKFFELTDFIVPLVPPALFVGRIGNFINGELWGKVTDVPWAMVFPYAGNLPRHPSQLYEAFLEGIVLFILMWLYTNKNKRKNKTMPPTMAASGLFCILYSSFRILVEFYRVPDQHLGYLAFDWVTMGQILSMPMLIVGIFLFILAYYKKEKIAL